MATAPNKNKCYKAEIKIGLLLFIFILYPVYSNTENALKVFPLPLLEVEQVVTKWLGDAGYTVHRSDLDMGQVKLRGKKENKEYWQIVIKPRSSLATQVAVESAPPDQASSIGGNELWAHIQAYLHPQPDTREEVNGPIPKAVTAHMESVVCMKALVAGEEIRFSGFVIDETGLIVCTAHTLDGLQAIWAVFDDGREILGTLVMRDPNRDLAMVHIPLRLDSHVALNRGRYLLEVGERLYSIGCPMNLSRTIYAGTINAPPRRVDGQPLWQVNMEIHPGSSGSPVFDTDGNIVAVVKGRFRGTDSVGFLIPFETLIAFVKGS
jgi:serine protease Do